MMALQVPVHIAQRKDRAGLGNVVGAFVTMVEDNLKRVVQRARVSADGPPGPLRACQPRLFRIPVHSGHCACHNVTHNQVLYCHDAATRLDVSCART